ncbi:response regulator transcription factor [Sulfitobacter sp. D35]|uniref:response regulator transcription factor n=1 Tax=Sulfitobacter sp. D35 TaxID=3083252 RepID=UPI00296F0261|nr:response regulator transcription factor [Sulfitobacter sp. D35]MDW4498798.1 response regulator transcription factor [Sulfitobacter sp. D35]
MTQPTILIVDDDPEITDALSRGLRMHGYATLTETTIEGAETRFAAPEVSAAIVDVMLGPLSGIDLVERLRRSGNEKPILMLSALAEVEDRAAGLQAGADDYIVKPFAFDELVARLQVQERRASAQPRPAFRLERAARAVQGQDRTEHLTEREFALIEMLDRHRGDVLSRGAIFDALWAQEGTSSENVVDVYIGYLRKKLAPLSDFGVEIQTIRNRGFMLRRVESQEQDD